MFFNISRLSFIYSLVASIGGNTKYSALDDYYTSMYSDALRYAVFYGEVLKETELLDRYEDKAAKSKKKLAENLSTMKEMMAGMRSLRNSPGEYRKMNNAISDFITTKDNCYLFLMDASMDYSGFLNGQYGAWRALYCNKKEWIPEYYHAIEEDKIEKGDLKKNEGLAVKYKSMQRRYFTFTADIKDIMKISDDICKFIKDEIDSQFLFNLIDDVYVKYKDDSLISKSISECKACIEGFNGENYRRISSNADLIRDRYNLLEEIKKMVSAGRNDSDIERKLDSYADKKIACEIKGASSPEMVQISLDSILSYVDIMASHDSKAAPSGHKKIVPESVNRKSDNYRERSDNSKIQQNPRGFSEQGHREHTRNDDINIDRKAIINEYKNAKDIAKNMKNSPEKNKSWFNGDRSLPAVVLCFCAILAQF